MSHKEISADLDTTFIDNLRKKLDEVIVGQSNLIEKIILAILSDGHILLEGLPGLAKTLTVKTIAQLINLNFNRIQFTPDLLPADILGTLIFNQQKNDFEVRRGPVFSNIILADEINRSPAKVQSALLEAMEERQVSIGSDTYKLDNPFLVMATQNPLDQDGTYPLPEAQIDRFMFKVIVSYPSKEEEKAILSRMAKFKIEREVKAIVEPSQILNARKFLDTVHISENIMNYIVNIIEATRKPQDYGLNSLQQLIQLGASPRGSIFLAKSAKSRAFLQNREYVTPDDIRFIFKDVLRHRIMLTYEAEAEEISQEYILNKIIESIPTP
tara:strand:- start:942 stop:1922 length:981 start_codon:yes stop_codon:yes gene_type:complete